MSENNIMPVITEESMSAFIASNPEFAATLNNHLMRWASMMDLSSLNHTRVLSEIPVGDPVSWQ